VYILYYIGDILPNRSSSEGIPRHI
jgi:hypothetical protein